MAKPAKTAPKSAHENIVFVDDEGKVIDKPRDVADVYKDYYQETMGEELGLDPSTIFDVIRNIPGDERGADKETIRKARLEALRKQQDKADDATAFTPPSAQSPKGVLASKYGAMAGHDATANAILVRVADAGETLTGAPIEFAYVLARKWGGKFDNQGYITEVPNIRTWPVPSTTQKDKPAGYNADKYKFEDRASGVTRNGHFVGDILKSFDEAAQLQSDINDLKSLGIAGFDVQFIKRKEYVAMYHAQATDPARKAELDRLNARWGKMVRCANGAISFLQVSTWLHQEFPEVQWGFPLAKGFDGSAEHITAVAKLRKPIQFSAKDTGRNPTSTPPWTLSQFNALQLPSKKYNGQIKLNVAKLNGGTLSAVLKTVERVKKDEAAALAKQGGDKDKTGKKQGQPSPQEIEAFGNMVLTGLDEKRDRDLADAYRSRIRVYFSAEGSEADARLLAFSSFVDELVMIRAPFKPRVERILSSQELQKMEAKTAEEKSKAAAS